MSAWPGSTTATSSPGRSCPCSPPGSWRPGPPSWSPPPSPHPDTTGTTTATAVATGRATKETDDARAGQPADAIKRGRGVDWNAIYLYHPVVFGSPPSGGVALCEHSVTKTGQTAFFLSEPADCTCSVGRRWLSPPPAATVRVGRFPRRPALLSGAAWGTDRAVGSDSIARRPAGQLRCGRACPGHLLQDAVTAVRPTASSDGGLCTALNTLAAR